MYVRCSDRTCKWAMCAVPSDGRGASLRETSLDARDDLSGLPTRASRVEGGDCVGTATDDEDTATGVRSRREGVRQTYSRSASASNLPRSPPPLLVLHLTPSQPCVCSSYTPTFPSLTLSPSRTPRNASAGRVETPQGGESAGQTAYRPRNTRCMSRALIETFESVQDEKQT